MEFLATDEKLQKHTAWNYIGIDSIDPNRKENPCNDILENAVKYGRGSSVRFIETSTFNKTFPEVNHDKAVLYVCRNVFHELKIEETSQLLHNVIARMKKSDKFLVQDLCTFPQAEKNNCGWNPGIFGNLLKQIGFHAVIELPLGSEKRWFNIICESDISSVHHPKYDLSRLEELVFENLQNQCNLWLQYERINDEVAEKDKIKRSQVQFCLQLSALIVRLNSYKRGFVTKTTPEKIYFYPICYEDEESLLRKIADQSDVPVEIVTRTWANNIDELRSTVSRGLEDGSLHVFHIGCTQFCKLFKLLDVLPLEFSDTWVSDDHFNRVDCMGFFKENLLMAIPWYLDVRCHILARKEGNHYDVLLNDKRLILPSGHTHMIGHAIGERMPKRLSPNEIVNVCKDYINDSKSLDVFNGGIDYIEQRKRFLNGENRDCVIYGDPCHLVSKDFPVGEITSKYILKSIKMNDEIVSFAGGSVLVMYCKQPSSPYLVNAGYRFVKNIVCDKDSLEYYVKRIKPPASKILRAMWMGEIKKEFPYLANVVREIVDDRKSQRLPLMATDGESEGIRNYLAKLISFAPQMFINQEAKKYLLKIWPSSPELESSVQPHALLMYLCEEIKNHPEVLSNLKDRLVPKIRKPEGYEIYKLAKKRLYMAFTKENMHTKNEKEEFMLKIFPFLPVLGFSSDEIIRSMELYKVPLG
ncbi:MAG: hypothetical protein HW390_2026 [Candidatus Brocadiaceae bacterium]|nr:hypothetical protein [Candidatus Brocadiaceae bacterium]